MKDRVLPLTLLPAGHKGVVYDIEGGHGLRRHLLELGFVRGAQIRVLKNERGPIIVSLDEARMALGRGAADKILIKKEE